MGKELTTAPCPGSGVREGGLAVVGRERKRRAAEASQSRSKLREVGGCVRRKVRGRERDKREGIRGDSNGALVGVRHMYR